MSTNKITFRHIEDHLKAMVMQNRGGQKVIERILMAYGFKSRQAFCNHLGISQSTMANRYARDTFPADWVVICSMETGASIEWLAFGLDAEEGMPSPSPEWHAEKQSGDEFCNEVHTPTIKFDNENHMDFTRGGKAAIERIVEAYGYKTRQALADHLGISKSTLATRYMRDIFPADWIIQCCLETGVSLEWLSFGKGRSNQTKLSGVLTLDCYDLRDGKLTDQRELIVSSEILPQNLKHPYIVNSANDSYIISKEEYLSDGLWLVSINGEFTFRDIFKLPNNRIRVENTKYSFECDKEDLEFNNKVKGIIRKRV
ncbi:phage repressor protein CI [Escherichia coli]|nr:phage repressor protein CI [Escherichia coli]